MVKHNVVRLPICSKISSVVRSGKIDSVVRLQICCKTDSVWKDYSYVKAMLLCEDHYVLTPTTVW